MRVRPLTVLTAIAAVTLVLAGCDEALAEAKVQASHGHAGQSAAARPLAVPPQPQLVQLLLDTSDGRVPPRPADRRIRRTAGTHPAGHRRRPPASGATLSVAILDRKTP